MSRSYDFSERLLWSDGATPGADIGAVLLKEIPGAAKVCKAEESDDRMGTDYWVVLKSGNKVSVDMKRREEDYAKRGLDDLALESWSVVEKKKIGWTLDVNKRCDYIFWFWQETGRWCLVPFRMLCGVFLEYKNDWLESYQVARQRTPWGDGHYHSECVFVPRVIVWRAIYQKYSGVPTTVLP